jgi:signal peptidase II
MVCANVVMRWWMLLKRKGSFVTFIIELLIFVTLDRITKIWAENANFSEADSFGLVRFTLVHNQGAAFGIGQGKQGLFIVIAAVIFIIILLWLLIASRHGKLEVFSLGLLAAGAFGNVVDRVDYGYVVDFIDFTFIDFPVFNVADICVVVGVILFVVSILFFSPQED